MLVRGGGNQVCTWQGNIYCGILTKLWRIKNTNAGEIATEEMV